MRLRLKCGVLTSEQLSLFLVKLLRYLTEGDLVEDGSLKQRVDAVQAAEHVLPLLLEVNHLLAVLHHFLVV